MKDLEKRFLQAFEEGHIEDKIKPTINFMELDEVAAEEFINLVNKEGLGKEIYVNTFKLMLDESSLEQYMKLFLEADKVAKEANKQLERIHSDIEKVVGGEMTNIEDKTETIVSNFFEHFGKQIQKLMLESQERQLTSE